MSINGSVQQREDTLNIAVNTGGVNHGPVRDFRTLNEPFLNGTNPSEAGKITVGPTVGMSVSGFQHVLMGSFLIHHHHHAQGHTPGVFPCFEQACARNDVNTLEQEVDAFPSSPFNGGRDARFNGQTGLVPIQHGLAAASSRKGRAVQRFSLLPLIYRPHDFANGVGRHDPSKSSSIGDADGCR